MEIVQEDCWLLQLLTSFPDLFQAAILKVPFLDPTNTLMQPIIPLLNVDYEEFGYPEDIEDFRAIREYSPYDNIKKDVLYPAILITSSSNARFGVWEAAKWAARMREYSYDPRRPVLLNFTTDLEDNKYAQCKESALETAFYSRRLMHIRDHTKEVIFAKFIWEGAIVYLMGEA